jgi:predicted  nucleic acid-binding Zn-ribbon protein
MSFKFNGEETAEINLAREAPNKARREHEAAKKKLSQVKADKKRHTLPSEIEKWHRRVKTAEAEVRAKKKAWDAASKEAKKTIDAVVTRAKARYNKDKNTPK